MITQGLYCFYLVHHVIINVMWQVQEPRQFLVFGKWFLAQNIRKVKVYGPWA